MAYCNSTSFSLPVLNGYIEPLSLQVFDFTTQMAASAGIITLLQVGLFLINSSLPNLSIKMQPKGQDYMTLFDKVNTNDQGLF